MIKLLFIGFSLLWQPAAPEENDTLRLNLPEVVELAKRNSIGQSRLQQSWKQSFGNGKPSSPTTSRSLH